nr:MAG TPA: hypothetical protein [Caudoviricetes sp.]
MTNSGISPKSFRGDFNFPTKSAVEKNERACL